MIDPTIFLFLSILAILGVVILSMILARKLKTWR